MSGKKKLQLVRASFKDAVVSSCCEHKCLLRMTGMGEFVILKGERLSTSKVCDCIIFYKQESYGVAIVELKSSYSHARPISEKFTNTLKIATEICKKMKLNVKSHHLILLSKNHRNPIASDILSEIKINPNGSTHRLRLKKCGDNLLPIIDSGRMNRRRRQRRSSIKGSI